MAAKTEGVITITVKCDLDYDEIFGRVHVQTQSTNTLDWVLNEFCREKKVARKPTFALRAEDMTELKLEKTLAESNLKDGSLIYAFNKELIMVPDKTPLDPPKPPPDIRDRKSCNVWHLLGILLILMTLLVVALMLCLWLIPAGSPRPKNLFGVLIDAGSTSSKIYLYKWPNPYPNKTQVSVTELKYGKTSPGISSYEDNPNEVSDSIISVIKSQIINELSPKDLSNTMLNLGATAGMRMLKYSNSSATDAILKNLRDNLPKTGLKMIEPKAQIRIISGTEEAVNAWITVNYVSGVFGEISQKTGRPITDPLPPNETYGSLDLGGASTQIAFVTKKDFAKSKSTEQKISPEDKFVTNLRLFGNDYPVYGHSFLCYGKSMAQARTLAIIANMSNFNLKLDNPCLPRGAKQKFLAKDVFNVPCVQGKFALNSYGYEIKPPANINLEKDTFEFTGSGNSQKCSDVVNKLFNTTMKCDYKKCSFNNIFQPDLRGPFYAFAGFTYVMEYLNLTEKKNRNAGTYDEFTTRLTKLCNSAETDIDYTVADDNNIINGYCFDGHYVKSLLGKYGFNKDNWNTITFVTDVNGYKVGWALGFMMEQTADSGIESTLTRRISLTAFVVPLILCFVLFIAAIAIIVYGKKQRRKKNYASSLQEYGSIE